MMLKFSILATAVLLPLGCAKKPDAESSSVAKSLYVSSGTCLSGPSNTIPAPSQIVYKVDLKTGTPGEIVADFNVTPAIAGDTPTGIVNIDDNYFMILVENTGFRRLEKVSKSSDHIRNPFAVFTTLAPTSGVGRSLARNSVDGSFYLGKTNGIEKFGNTASRNPSSGVNAWVVASAMAATNCASTSISSVQVTPTGKTIFTNYGAGAGKVGVIKNVNGFLTAPDCMSAVNTSLATALPTASLYLPAYNQVLVTFAGPNSAANNYISAYDYDDTTGIISNEGTAFKDTGVIYGASAITMDSDTGKIYVATANASSTAIANYNIEEFTYDPTSRTLTRAGSLPFASSWVGSKCITGMFVGN